jgi:hypothetical protein
VDERSRDGYQDIVDMMISRYENITNSENEIFEIKPPKPHQAALLLVNRVA